MSPSFSCCLVRIHTLCDFNTQRWNSALTFAAILIIALVPVSRVPTPYDLESNTHLLSAQPEYSGITASFTRVGHSIVCCRILLNLNRAASWRGDLSDAPTHNIAFAVPPRQRTEQTEMSWLNSEASGTRSDEGGYRLQADGVLLQDRHCPTGEAESNDDSMYIVAR